MDMRQCHSKKSGVWDKVPGSTIIFGDAGISFLKHSVGWVEGSSHAKN